jgi:uncharacterized protein
MKANSIEHTAVEDDDDSHKSAAHDINHILHELKHYLPAQAPLKDFIHHNTLHAFQTLKFHSALQHASVMFGYKVSLPLAEYRRLHEDKKINDAQLDRVIAQAKGAENISPWKHKLLYHEYKENASPRIGALRAHWKKTYRIDLDSLVHPTLFRVVCSYLDQGISIWNFPVWHKGFLSSIREIEKNSFTSFFRTKHARNLLLDEKHDLHHLLRMVVGSDSLHQQYLFDQQFAHQGWSGIVSAIEDQPETLLDRKKISLRDLIYFELLLEIDALTYQLGNRWSTLDQVVPANLIDLFEPVKPSELQEVMALWQEAYEWNYYDEVLNGLHQARTVSAAREAKTFQAMFCIDDRECSLRRHLESHDPNCDTYGTPGFFSVEFFFQPEHGKFYTKLCPAPVTPKYLIKEAGTKGKRQRDPHFHKHTHTLFRGWLISQTLGFWSALKLFINIFKPSSQPGTATSFSHMDKISKLTIEHQAGSPLENDLQVGFTIDEMATRVEGLLKSIGLVKGFAPIVYVVGHGSSSINNPHYAAYDCGACSGRPGSVNARVISFMANHPQVRAILATRGIDIPDTTKFVGGLHDTSRDEVAFYDEDSLGEMHKKQHIHNLSVFESALKVNSKERSRRFQSIDTASTTDRIHERVKRRTVSLFEPRPELNHATNALCIVGRRSLTQHVFLDRRSFLNSFDYKVDPDGKYLLNILKAAAPVCGGINLEYFFSRVDNQKLGAGTKLPHNVMGLFGVANGIEGDLRPGLPSQMIEVHDPVRLLMIVEHFPEVVLNVIKSNPATYEWFINEWVHLVVINPETGELSRFKEGEFYDYLPKPGTVKKTDNLNTVFEQHYNNLPVYLID